MCFLNGIENIPYDTLAYLRDIPVKDKIIGNRTHPYHIPISRGILGTYGNSSGHSQDMLSCVVILYKYDTLPINNHYKPVDFTKRLILLNAIRIC